MCRRDGERRGSRPRLVPAKDCSHTVSQNNTAGRPAATGRPRALRFPMQTGRSREGASSAGGKVGPSPATGFHGFLEGEADRSQQRSDRGWRSQGPLVGRRAAGRVAEPWEAPSRGSHTEIPGLLLSRTDEAAGKRDRDDPRESHPGRAERRVTWAHPCTTGRTGKYAEPDTCSEKAEKALEGANTCLETSLDLDNEDKAVSGVWEEVEQAENKR